MRNGDLTNFYTPVEQKYILKVRRGLRANDKAVCLKVQLHKKETLSKNWLEKMKHRRGKIQARYHRSNQFFSICYTSVLAKEATLLFVADSSFVNWFNPSPAIPENGTPYLTFSIASCILRNAIRHTSTTFPIFRTFLFELERRSRKTSN